MWQYEKSQFFTDFQTRKKTEMSKAINIPGVSLDRCAIIIKCPLLYFFFDNNKNKLKIEI